MRYSSGLAHPPLDAWGPTPHSTAAASLKERDLSAHNVVEWLNAGGTVVSAIATVAICVFAYVQIRDAAIARKDNRRAVLASLRTEQYRLRHVAERWTNYDLVGMAIQGTLNAGDLAPPDWGFVANLLGQAGDAAGAIASVSYGRLSDARYYADQLTALAGNLRDAGAYGIPGTAASTIGTQMKTVEAELRKCLVECADGLADALSAAQPEGWRAEIPLNLNSAVASNIREAIQETEKILNSGKTKVE